MRGENVFRSLVEEAVLRAFQRKRETRVDPALHPHQEAGSGECSDGSRMKEQRQLLKGGRRGGCETVQRHHVDTGGRTEPAECPGHQAMGNLHQPGRERKI